ncbi:hypothetical protein FQA39_LY16090 [Lamprigera yunnana]|nr:hypothetical protein FQA39_LY16090 [Lamprigera yunnana]
MAKSKLKLSQPRKNRKVHLRTIAISWKTVLASTSKEQIKSQYDYPKSSSSTGNATCVGDTRDEILSSYTDSDDFGKDD